MSELVPRRRSIFALVLAVHDLDQAVNSYQKLGFGVRHRAPREEWGVDAAMLDVDNGIFELIQPVDRSKLVAQKFQDFLDQRGQGLYLVSFAVDDIDQEYKLLVEQGVRVPGPPTVAPPDGDVDARLLWPSPRSAEGALIELLELGASFTAPPRNVEEG